MKCVYCVVERFEAQNKGDVDSHLNGARDADVNWAGLSLCFKHFRAEVENSELEPAAFGKAGRITLQGLRSKS